MPPECWPRWRGNPEILIGEFEEFRDARVIGGEDRRGESGAPLCLWGLSIRSWPIEAGEPIQFVLFEPERFADIAHGGAAAIGNDVCGHGRAELAVTLVDVLNGSLALIAAGEIEIDVGPFAAFFGEEPFKQQFHADGIDGGDPERITDGAVCGRAAALHQNAFAAAELDDVPDDQEIAFELQLFDHGELVFNLTAGFFVIRAVAVSRALFRALAQKGGLGFAVGQRVARKLIAEVFEREGKARGEFAGFGDGFGDVGKQTRHLRCGFQVPLAVEAQQCSRFGDCGFVFRAGEDVEQRTALRTGVGDSVGGEDRQFEAAREFD